MSKFLIIAPLVILTLFPVYFFLKPAPPLPKIDLKAWWGPEELRGNHTTNVKNFKIEFRNDRIKELQERLLRTSSYIPPLEGVGFEYGFNSKHLKGWLKYWAEQYPFKERELFFNQFPHFITNVQGLDIHFIKVSPKNPSGKEVVPLLLLNGWPSSFREFYEAIPLLTAVSNDRDFAVEVIVPSLPGYGYSSAAVRPGLGANEIAVVFRNLMHRLGYTKYYVQGADWGALVGTTMATLFPNEVLGFHINGPVTFSSKASVMEVLCSFFPSLIVDSDLADRMYPLSKKFSTLVEEMGYMHIQSTKPDTIGVALTDSPAGLLAYILEKFSSWTELDYRQREDGGLLQKWTKEQLIDNLVVYYFTNSITTSMRLYSESFNSRHFGSQLDEIPTPVPTWGIQQKHEIVYQPSFLLKFKYPNLIGTTVLDDGGHFLALEMPEVFAADVLKALGEFRKLKKNKTEL